MKNVLIVEDNPAMLRGLEDNFASKGYYVRTAVDGQQGLNSALAERPDLIILDIMLPKINGYEVCSLIREKSLDMPIIMLTAKGEESDIILGLNLGADDYVTKPFSPRQLVARAHAVMRRAGKTSLDTLRQVGPLTCDLSRRELQFGDGEPVSLTPLESRLLDYLVLNAGHVLTAEAIINHVWGAEGADRDMLRQLVHRLRNKISQACQGQAGSADTSQSIYIETVPGLGYGLIVPSHER
jgi:DNA-binding response OmpR family regulator